MPRLNTTRAPDEKAVRIEGGIRIAVLRNGGRRKEHPSGLVSVESAEQVSQEGRQLKASVDDARRLLAEHIQEFQE
jgi:hypothetical protein|tara:strand:+ start:1066 stop:1293 length:228 start_codon:yes stop_codon:yes gene_type:complete